MNSWLHSLFSTTADPTRDLSLSHEGLPWGWAFVLFLLLAATGFWAYHTCSPTLTPRSRHFLSILRTLTLALALFLLTRPVIMTTVREPVRQSLLVLVDASDSMNLADKRNQPQDLRRAAIATGTLPPDAPVDGPPPPQPASLASLSRWELFLRLSANPRLNLWPRIFQQSDLTPFRFGRDATPLPPLPEDASSWTPDDFKSYFAAFSPTDTSTAIGESLRQALNQTNPQSLSGILILTDGANNSGLPPADAALLARDLGLPLWIVGLGVTSPTDLAIREFSVPRTAFVKERLDVTLRIHTQDLTGKTARAILLANGKPVDEREFTILRDGEAEWPLSFIPDEPGSIELTAQLTSFEGESSLDNNTASARARIINTKARLLLLERQPRWDFHYLLDFLRRDRRLEVKAAVTLAEPGLDREPSSPFLPSLPESRAELLAYEILILGDVAPADLGNTRMELIREWVEKLGGGLIFHAGTGFNPHAFLGTPLEPLLPIIPADQPPARALEPIPLQLSLAGETSDLIKLDDNPDENRRLWQQFPGVRWTAATLRAKPGARVLLVDPTPERATRDGPMPVLATQAYGAGQVIFIGTDETYRLRSQRGEKLFARLWGQSIQSLSADRLEGASSLAQLRPGKPTYFVGDKVTISGRLLAPGFTPRTEPSIPAQLSLPTSPGTPTLTEPLPLLALPGQPGHYRAEFIARVPGQHIFTPTDIPNATVKIDVIEPKFERLETAMNESLLHAMAENAGGTFLREEDLHRLPSLIAARQATVDSYRQFRLFHSPWWLLPIFLLLFIEWTLRRLWQLK